MLYLIQHGEAQQDEPKALTDRGRAETLRISSFLKKNGIKPSEIWHSTKLRAKQTAELLGLAPLIEKEGLAPNNLPARWVDEVNLLQKDIILVAHLPFLSKLASLLITGDEGQTVIKFRNSGVVCLARELGGWAVRWIVWPEIA